MLFAIVLVVLAVAAGVFLVVGFNRLRQQDVRAQEALGGIDVQLTRRADLLPNLVETVKGYAAHERGLFDEVTAARSGVAAATQSGRVQDRVQAERALGKALVDVLAVAENYPELKASEGFLSLQTQLAGTEDQLAFARQYYNDSVATLNTTAVTVPWMWLTGMAGVHQREFYAADPAQQSPPKVDF